MDIDVDSGDRDRILRLIRHVPASIVRNGVAVKHNTGVYVTAIPVDPAVGYASIDHKTAEALGYVKLDFLNVNVYELVRDEQHLQQLMRTEPPWQQLHDPEFVSKIIHINQHWSTLQKLAEPVNSIPRLAMFLALIRPAKRHLIGLDWKQIAQEIWTKPLDDSYYYKKSHAVSYAYLTAMHMNLLVEKSSV